MIGCLTTQALAFLAVFVYATHATQAIACEWKPGFTLCKPSLLLQAARMLNWILNAGVRDCTLSTTGYEYIGQTAVTTSGKLCQAWTAHYPHEHSFKQDHMYPDGSVKNARNYCRNPENGYVGIWCYTTDPDVRWERCDVPTCGQSGTDPIASHESA